MIGLIVIWIDTRWGRPKKKITEWSNLGAV